ncbi:protein translocase subunit SecD [Nakamurella sp. A5-74]|uniref:Protein translocase subunit SecD n=1 Tax=Nakamurella sp. A5-74 TaxID=3158264 RepID=A0AAU8DN41_9ACTN
MASTQSGKFRPWTLIWSYVGLVVLLYGLVFLTPGQNTMKLGIDLQGGTRVTLQAKTADGTAPTRESMQQARTIMETRVNGSGVVGAQVQLDGASQLVVTVPGQKDLAALTRAAKLNIRPVEGSPVPIGLGTDPSASESSTAPSSSGSSGSSSATSSATEEPAIGDTITESSPPAPSASAGIGNNPSEQSSAGSSAPASENSNGVRGRVAAVTTPSASSADAGTTGRMTTQGAPSEGSATASTTAVSTTAAPTTAPSTTAAGSGSSAPSTSGASGSGSSAAGSSAPGSSGAATGPQWPAGSDPNIPIQPSGTDAAASTAWLTAAQSAIQTGTITCGDVLKYQGLDNPDKPVLACDPENINLYVLDKTLIPGDQVASASAGLDSGGSGWVINIGFNSTGFNTWAAYTTANVGKVTSFTLDGQVLSASTIREPITTPTTQVSGGFTQDTATSLANSLKFGSLPLQFILDKSDEVSAEVGSESLQAGLIAGGIGLLLVILYCLLYYRLLGLITVLSLVLSGVLVYAVMVLLGRWMDLSLDMAGVAGLIIAIGITADSFVVYFERLKDEVREGRTFRSAVPRGWERAKRTILSADAVTFLSAVILYVLAVGEVKGFAFTLGLSTILDLVVVFLVTHPLIALAAGSKVFTSPKLSGLGAVAEAGARHRTATSRLTPKEA